MKTEIAVVGAGPAGSVAAGMLAQRGHEVLLLDKADFPRDKFCGDAIATMALGIMDELGLSDELEAANGNPVKSIQFHFHQKITITIDIHSTARGIILPRTKFDSILYKYAIAAGAQPCKAMARKPLIENDRVVGIEATRDGSVETIFARVVLIADGANSSIARTLNPNVAGRNGYALRAYVENLALAQHNLDFYLDAGSFGYSWVFPTNATTANVGFGRMASKGADAKSIKQSFDDFIQFCIAKSPAPEKVIVHPVGGSQLNLGYQTEFKRAFDGALILGDAARLVNPATGSGIANAMLAGKIAAEVVDSALQRNDVSQNSLHEYEVRLRKQLYWEQKFAKFIYNLNHLPLPIQHTVLRSSGVVNTLSWLYRRIYTDIPAIRVDKKVAENGKVEIRVRA